MEMPICIRHACICSCGHVGAYIYAYECICMHMRAWHAYSIRWGSQSPGPYHGGGDREPWTPGQYIYIDICIYYICSTCVLNIMYYDVSVSYYVHMWYYVYLYYSTKNTSCYSFVFAGGSEGFGSGRDPVTGGCTTVGSLGCRMKSLCVVQVLCWLC